MRVVPEFLLGMLALLMCGVGGLVLENNMQLQTISLSLLLISPVWVSSALRLIRARKAEPQSARAVGATEQSGIPVRKSAELVTHPLTWRFAVNYSGLSVSFVVLALWLPHYLAGSYKLDTVGAALVGLAWVLPAALFRGYGATLAQRFGEQRMMYCSLAGILVVTFLLSYPPTHYQVHGISREIPFALIMELPLFTALMVTLGLFLTLGQAALFEHIRCYYPQRITTVSAMVRVAGTTIAVPIMLASATLSDHSGIWQVSFMLLFLMTLFMLLRMHLAILRAERREEAGTLAPAAVPELRNAPVKKL